MYLAQMRVRFDTLIIYVCFYTLYFIFNLKTLREGLPPFIITSKTHVQRSVVMAFW